MPKTATVYDVAELAGVSIATVSATFRQPERVRPKTREAVEAAARRLNYVPSASARSLAAGRSGALGLFAYDYLRLTEPVTVLPPEGELVEITRGGPEEACRQFPLYVDEVQRGVELECWERGYALMIGGTGRSKPEVRVTDIAGRVDGLAVFPGTVSSGMLDRISRRIPVVALSTPDLGDRVSHVTVDNRRGVRAVTEHLIREHGVRQLLFVGQLHTEENRSRFDGFKDALRACGLPVPRKSHSLTADTAPRGVLDSQAEREVPIGVVCANDDEALRVMDVLAGHRVDVPRQVAVTGFDGIVAGGIARPSLTTLRQPMVQMGRVAVDILLDQIATPDQSHIVRELPLQLLLGESCGCRAPSPSGGG